MTKEEIIAQVSLLHKSFTREEVITKILELSNELELAKSIEDLQREAFEAGVKYVPDNPFADEKEDIDKAFKNYLKEIDGK